MNTFIYLRATLVLSAVAFLLGCAGRSGLESPVRDVGGTSYFTVTARAPESGSYDFTKKLAWLSGASELSRARSTEVYARLTQEQRADLNGVLTRGAERALREIEGFVDFIDEATSSVPIRNVHELGLRREEGELILTLGVPMDTWNELVDEAAREVMVLLRRQQMSGSPPLAASRE